MNPNTDSHSKNSRSMISKPATQNDLKEFREEFRETIAEILITVGQNFDRVDAELSTIKKTLSNFATKDDLANFATKDDLANFATKDDLANFATKEDIANLPTKDDFFTYMDQMVGEYKTFNQESTLLTGRVSDHETRICILENQAAS